MQRRVYLSALVVTLLLVPAFALAQGNFDLKYDPQSVTSLTGTIVTTINYNPNNPLMGPQGVVLSSGGQYYTVFLGPGRFLNKLGLSLRSGDWITVTASRRTIKGQDYLVASRLLLGTKTFDLRSETGAPLWYGRSMRSMPPIGSGPGMEMGTIIPFDANRLVRVSGKIWSISTIMTDESSVPYVVAVLAPSSAFRHDNKVLLGPMDILQSSNLDISPGAYLSAYGSSVDIDGERHLVATSVSQGTVFLNLRTLTGVPLFSVSQSGSLFSPPDSNF